LRAVTRTRNEVARPPAGDSVADLDVQAPVVYLGLELNLSSLPGKCHLNLVAVIAVVDRVAPSFGWPYLNQIQGVSFVAEFHLARLAHLVNVILAGKLLTAALTGGCGAGLALATGRSRVPGGSPGGNLRRFVVSASNRAERQAHNADQQQEFAHFVPFQTAI